MPSPLSHACFQGGDDSEVVFDEASRATIRNALLQLIFHCPDAIERQLGEAIALIGQRDFPHHWPELLPALVAEFTSDDHRRVACALRTSHALFKRYRYEMKCDALWLEIKLVLHNVRISLPLTSLMCLDGGAVDGTL